MTFTFACNFFFFFQAEDGIRDLYVTGVQTCALPISPRGPDEKPYSQRTCFSTSGTLRSLYGAIGGSKHLARFVKKYFACWSKAYLPLISIEKGHAHFMFKVKDLFADCGLRNV